MAWHILIKLTKIKHTERILKPSREKKKKPSREKQEVTYKGNPICLIADFSSETLQARREWNDTFKVLRGKHLQSRLPYLQRSQSKLMKKSKA